MCSMSLKPVLQLWVIVSHCFMLNSLEIMKDIFCLKGVHITLAISLNSEFTLNLRHVYCYSELEDQSIKI